ncbi:MAG: ribonuclease J [Alphaproteobacteria bacterium]|nr:ribonuclease J [Alphaproteobacteria bacterium]
MNNFNKSGIYFLPLGGADEIGMNMYAYAVNGKIIVVDVGYGFLNDEYPGMDMCYASPEFLQYYKDDILGIFITHGHEDHMGAIAQIWPALQCPVYGMDFPLGLIRSRLEEYKMQDIVPLISVKNNHIVKFDDFEIEFIPIAHTVPETSALFIKTPYGNIMHATDWRFDDNKLPEVKTDFAALQRAADAGVDILVNDSTNIYVDKEQQSEEDVRQHLIDMVSKIKGGIVATCFASNIMRLESLALAAKAAGRTPVLFGRSLITNAKIAKDCGYMKECGELHTIEQVEGITTDKALYICTGSQANYRSAMTIIANDESKYIKLSQDDTVIFSSKIIPGNEDKIERLQEKMREKGVQLITEEEYPVHTSGHANRHDLQKMYKLLNPKIVLPVHGDKKFIREHKRFALSCGVKDVFSAQNGDICLYQNHKIEKIAQITSDIMGVDRGRSVSLASELIKNRRRIMYNCTLFISAVVEENLRLHSLDISSIDILEENEWYVLKQEILKEVYPLIEKKVLEHPHRNALEDFIRGQIRRRVYKATDIKPVTILQIHWLNDQATVETSDKTSEENNDE